MKNLIRLLFVIVMASSPLALTATELYPLPASWSYRSIASYSQPRIKSFDSLGDLNTAGTPASRDIVLILDASPTLRVWDSLEWKVVGGSENSEPGSGIVLATSVSGLSSPTTWIDTSAGQLYFKEDYISGYASAPASLSEFPESVYYWTGQPSGATWQTGTAMILPSDASVMFDQSPSTFKVYTPHPWGGEYLSSGMVEFGDGGYYSQITASCPYFHYTSIRYLSIRFATGYATPTFLVLSRMNSSWANETTVASTSCASWVVGTTYFVPVPAALASATPGDWRNIRLRFTHASTDASSTFAVSEVGLHQEVLSPVPASRYRPVVPPASFAVSTPSVAPTTATPTDPATGTLWMDGNTTPPKMKAWDGTSWNALW